MGFLALFLLAAAETNGPTPQELHAMARKTVELQTRLFDELSRHCFIMRIHQEEPGEGPNRRKEDRLEQVCFRDGAPVYKYLEINGRPTGVKLEDPFPPPDENWPRRAEKVREGRKTQIDVMQQCLKAFNFSYVADAVIDGRAATVIDVKPNPHYQAVSRTTEMLKSVTGRVWIDKQTGYLLKGQATTFRDFRLWGGLLIKIKEGAHFEIRQKPFGSTWLPYFLEQRWEGRVAMVKKIGDHYRLERFDFKEGSADRPGIAAGRP